MPTVPKPDVKYTATFIFDRRPFLVYKDAGNWAKIIATHMSINHQDPYSLDTDELKELTANVENVKQLLDIPAETTISTSQLAI
jgi:hypothetical protein